MPVPAVIKDAIEVSLKLGLRFIWVDRYCIRQDDPEKHRLILSMDEVYAKTCITIIAAAGKTAADGLPGISNIPRLAQTETHIGGSTLLELPSILNSTRSSTWTQRGWTYQEGLLYTRHLTCAPISVEIPDKSTYFYEQKAKHLYVTGPLAKLRLVGANRLPNSGEFPNLDFRTCHHHVMLEERAPGIFAVIRLSLSVEPEVGEQTFGLLFTTEIGSDEEKRFSIHGLIVLRKGDKSFTRIGCMRLEDFWVRKYVNIDGASTVKRTMPPLNGWRYFGQEFTRQRICLE
ncbi:putative tol protein [Botrytis fragariae]|uniref:Putative tol protein n=1 Tax=Botrytis fragariae TaxID=1964551 RepID=A0A8H6AT59_9HELO|nr:putative tol protein [Botrytis fragariae]KAF5873132.1 putative tol protein [Botrytis fragariae]